jgi:hypothetical protein
VFWLSILNPNYTSNTAGMNHLKIPNVTVLSTHLPYSALFCFSSFSSFSLFLLFYFPNRNKSRSDVQRNGDAEIPGIRAHVHCNQVCRFDRWTCSWLAVSHGHTTALDCTAECHFYLVQLTEIWQWRELHYANVVWLKIACLENTLMATFLLRINLLV